MFIDLNGGRWDPAPPDVDDAEAACSPSLPTRSTKCGSGPAGHLPELLEVPALAEAGRIRPHVQRFTLDNATDAYEAMRAGTLEGRAVIVPS